MTTTAPAPQNETAPTSTGPILLHSLRPQNLLSFGPDTPEIPLGPLNVLIGANGSGKSNLIETVSLLRSTPTSLQDVLRKGGGAQEWIWKGNPDESASIATSMADTAGHLLRHNIEFTVEQQAYKLRAESVWQKDKNLLGDFTQHTYQYRDGWGSIIINGQLTSADVFTFDTSASVLAQRRDPEKYPEITYLAAQYGRIRIYREWSFGRNTVLRAPQPADMRTDRLEEDFSNLGLVLNRMRRNSDAKKAVLSHLRDIYDGVEDFDVSVEGGTVQVFLTEGRFTIPATRLSDGTLRYLCLLAILCDPTPPPLICIEEPELGLHPDILPKIADLLVDASQRTQIIVTTHSDILVDAMTERPEAVLVCEKHDGQTQIMRLSSEDLGVWLEKYRLGELWTRGQLGGTRW